MKKVISSFLVAIMLISFSVVTFAEQDGIKFVSNKDRNILTEDGRFFY